MIAYIHATDGTVLSHDFGNITVRQAWYACRKHFGHAQKNSFLYYQDSCNVIWHFDKAEVLLAGVPAEIHHGYRTKQSK